MKSNRINYKIFFFIFLPVKLLFEDQGNVLIIIDWILKRNVSYTNYKHKRYTRIYPEVIEIDTLPLNFLIYFAEWNFFNALSAYK